MGNKKTDFEVSALLGARPSFSRTPEESKPNTIAINSLPAMITDMVCPVPKQKAQMQMPVHCSGMEGQISHSEGLSKHGIAKQNTRDSEGLPQTVKIIDVKDNWQKIEFSPQIGKSSPSSEKHLVFVSGHSLRWCWIIAGETFRKPHKIVRLYHWNKRIYNWKGVKVVLNMKQAEFWLDSRSYETTEQLLYENWARADLLAREFSEWARIGLKPVYSEAADCQGAHLTFEKKRINEPLLPLLDGPGRAGAIPYEPEGVGLHETRSHPDKAQLDGKFSIPGMKGAEWLYLQFRREWQEKLTTDAERWQGQEAAIGLLRAEHAQLAEGQAVIMESIAGGRR